MWTCAGHVICLGLSFLIRILGTKLSPCFIRLLRGLRVHRKLLGKYSEPRKHYISSWVQERKAMGLPSGRQGLNPGAVTCCCVTVS